MGAGAKGVLHMEVSGGVPWVAGDPLSILRAAERGWGRPLLIPSFGRTCAAVMAHLWRMCCIRSMDCPYTVGKGGRHLGLRTSSGRNAAAIPLR